MVAVVDAKCVRLEVSRNCFRYTGRNDISQLKNMIKEISKRATSAICILEQLAILTKRGRSQEASPYRFDYEKFAAWLPVNYFGVMLALLKRLL